MKKLTPKLAVKLKCLQDSNYQLGEVRKSRKQYLTYGDLLYRKGKVKATEIRHICVKDCGENSWLEADNCKHFECPFYPYRNGRTPTEEELNRFWKAYNADKESTLAGMNHETK